MTAVERLFFGVSLPPALRTRIEGSLRGRTDPPGRATPPENWHITLRFLGETDTETRGAVEGAISGLSLPQRFSARISGWGAFPRPAAARVLWLGVVDGSGELARIAEELEAVARRVGFAPESRPFRPHVTLARFPSPEDLRPLLAALPPIDEPLPVHEIILFRSRLGGGPARYDPLHRLPLPT